MRVLRRIGRVRRSIASRLLGDKVALSLARRARARRPNSTFVAITGSVGKTTTKRIVAAVLAVDGTTRSTPRSQNETLTLARFLRTTKRADRWIVLEVGAPSPGHIDETLALIRPDVGVVTTVRQDHISAYGSREALAREKAKLVAALPASGICILNADDPQVLAMRDGFSGRVVTYGETPDADLRAENVFAEWPDRLKFTACHGSARVLVESRLVGRHFLGSVLAALATGIAVGVPLTDAARAVGTVQPMLGRMYASTTDDGVTFIRDEWKASLDGFADVFEFLRTARGARRFLIVGTVSDYRERSTNVYVDLARKGLEVADYVFFVGPRSSTAMRLRGHVDPDRLRTFAGVEHVTDHLRTLLREGDLVFLKGSTSADHLERIALAQSVDVHCRRSDCKRLSFCDSCPLLQEPSAPPAVTSSQDDGDWGIGAPVEGAEPIDHVLVGLGNPGTSFENTPHNVGYAIVDRVAERLGAAWVQHRRVATARATWKGRHLLLVKPNVLINKTGPVLQAVVDAYGLDPESCILLHDDLDLPFGRVRGRMHGGDGGHRGVRSILHTLETAYLPRVKVGMSGRNVGEAKEDVLTPFSTEEQSKIDAACDVAIDRAFETMHKSEHRA